MSELIGRTFGNYQIIEQIGMGGMATVYKAYQVNMDRHVAVKVLPRQLAEDPAFMGRFEQEARTIARLENKHILPVYDFGTEDGYTYLVMRYVGHGTLKDLTARGSLPLNDCVVYLAQIADALDYAHAHDVIHRDVKTSNVLLGEDQQLYLTDFGIAKLTSGSSQFTGSGAIVGTPAYMSPEQCSGLPLDSRSDIYSLGVVLYEMLTGALPFEAETPVAVVMMHVSQPLPSPRTRNPHVPEPVERVVFRVLAKDPAARYQTGADLATALQSAVESVAESATAIFPMPPLAPGSDAPTTTAMLSEEPTKILDTSPPTQPNAPTSARVVAAGNPRRRLWVALALMLVAVVGAVIVALAVGGGDEGDNETPDAGLQVMADAPSGDDVPSEDGASSSDAAPVAEGAFEPVQVADATGEAEAPYEIEIPGELAAADSAAPPLWTVYASTRSGDSDDRRLATSADGLWMTSPGGLVFWSYDGESTHYTSADGLAFNDLADLAFDAGGGLWLAGDGNQEGVMRVEVGPDGALGEIELFMPETSLLESPHVNTLLPDEDRGMMFGTYGSYLEGWQGGEWSLLADAGDDVLQTIGDRVWTITRARDGALWLGGSEGLVRQVDGAWQAVEPPPLAAADSKEHYEYTLLYADPLDGTIWVVVVTTSDYVAHTVRLLPPAEAGGDWTWEMPEDWVPAYLSSVLRASDGTLWLVGEGDVVRVDAEGNHRLFNYEDGIPGQWVNDIIEGVDGNIWLTTENALVRFDGLRWTPFFAADPVYEGAMVSVDETADGTLWFTGSYGQVHSFEDGVWDDDVLLIDMDTRALAMQGDVLWLGTGEGLVRWDGSQTTTFGVADGLIDPEIWALAVDANAPEMLWIGTARGLSRLDTATDTWQSWSTDDLPGPAISMLQFDADGVLWAGTGYSVNWDGPREPALLRLVDGVWETVAELGAPFDEADGWVESVAWLDDGSLWVGTEYGLYRRDANGDWKHFTVVDDNAPEYVGIPALVPDGKGGMWVATEFYGLAHFDGRVWRWLGREGIGSGFVNDMFAARDGALWILTRDAIVRMTGDPLAQ